MRRRLSQWIARKRGPRITAGPIPGSIQARSPSILRDGETIYMDPEGMSMGAQGQSYFQGTLPSTQSDVSLTVATNQRILIYGSAASPQHSIPWTDVSGYWRGEIPFPSIPPETGEAVVIFLNEPDTYAPFPNADLVIDPRGDADSWEYALTSEGKEMR